MTKQQCLMSEAILLDRGDAIKSRLARLTLESRKALSQAAWACEQIDYGKTVHQLPASFVTRTQPGMVSEIGRSGSHLESPPRDF
jgi:hypothetical protein